MNKIARLLIPAATCLAGFAVTMAPIANADAQDDAFLQALDQNGVSFPTFPLPALPAWGTAFARTGPTGPASARSSRMCKAQLS